MEQSPPPTRTRTDPRTSMPPRGQKPGFKIGRTRTDGTRMPFWVAKQVARDTLGFADRCIPLTPLPAAADAQMLAALEARWAEECQYNTARLMAWIAEVSAGVDRPVYDGTVASLCRAYQTHPESPFRFVKANTRKTYADSLKVVEDTVGQRLVRRLTTIDVRGWYRRWKEPKEDGGRERIDRAHDAVSMFRTVLRFGAALRQKECGELDAALAMMRFEKGGAREAEMTLAHARAFLRTAPDLGRRAVIPADRALYMAIGVAAQFETGLRQKDIIGEWHAHQADAAAAIARGAAAVAEGEETWTGFFVWERVPGWRWRTRTSKSKYRARAEFDLAQLGLLFPLLEAVPHAERTGAVVKGEHGLPVRERSYRKWFRAIAAAAGIPDEVWNMDTRAGAATEAEEAGADLGAIQNALTHTRPETTLRYIRRRARDIKTVAQARAAKRAADGGEDV
jgi:Phage integrase family